MRCSVYSADLEKSKQDFLHGA